MTKQEAYVAGFVKAAKAVSEDDIPEDVLADIATQAWAHSLVDQAAKSGWMHRQAMEGVSSGSITPEEFAKYRRLHRSPKNQDEKAYKRHKRLNWMFPAGAAIGGGLGSAAVGALIGGASGEDPGKAALYSGVSGAGIAALAMYVAQRKRNAQIRAELKLGKRWPAAATITPWSSYNANPFLVEQ